MTPLKTTITLKSFQSYLEVEVAFISPDILNLPNPGELLPLKS